MIISIIGYVPLFHGLVFIHYGVEPDFNNVSGFYGPGAVLARLLTVCLVVLNYALNEKMDPAGFSAIFAYVSVAAVDAILHVLRNEYDAQYDAASTVCLYMTIIIIPCLDLRLPLRLCLMPRELGLWLLLFVICVIPTLPGFVSPVRCLSDILSPGAPVFHTVSKTKCLNSYFYFLYSEKHDCLLII